MAFGFPPKYIQDFQLGDQDPEHFLVVALEAVKELSWKINTIDETGFTAYTNFSMRSWSEVITVKIEDDIANITSECTDNQLTDWGKNKKNIRRFIEQIEAVKARLSPEEMAALFGSLKEHIATVHTIDLWEETPEKAQQGRAGFFALFKPAKGYLITPILVLINILVFVVMLIDGVNALMPESQDLLDWGANFRPITLSGEWWRLFTACFLHIGVLHLLLNMYALLYIGVLLEPYLGKTRFLVAYLVCGIVSSMASLWWNDLTISAGASGAVFGMYGVFIALLTTSLVDKAMKKPLLASVGVFVAYNIVYGLKPGSNIDNAAHIGGLLSGLVIGYSFVPGIKQYENKRIKFLTICIVAFLLLTTSFIYYRKLSVDMKTYEEGMKKFVAMESMALEVFSLPEGTPDEAILKEFRSRGIYYWDENIKLIGSFKELDLPASITSRNSKLLEYCTLRVESYQLICRAIVEETDKYNQELARYQQKIQAIMDEIAGK